MGIIEKVQVDDVTYARLADDARRHGRTIAEEAAVELQGRARSLSRDEFIRRANEIAALTPKGVAQTDSLNLLREDRDR